jgi:hypothetical protein
MDLIGGEDMERFKGNDKSSKTPLVFAIAVALLFMLLNPCTWSPYSAPEPTPTPATAKYHFETGREGWVSSFCTNGPVVINTDPAYCALSTLGSVKCNIITNSPCFEFSRSFSPAINLQGKKINAYIYVPEWMSDPVKNSQVYMRVNSYDYSSYTSLTRTGWSKISFSPTAYGTDTVQLIALHVNWQPITTTAEVFYIDEISY